MKKLKLTGETIRRLGVASLTQARGGQIADTDTGFGCNTETCGSDLFMCYTFDDEGMCASQICSRSPICTTGCVPFTTYPPE